MIETVLIVSSERTPTVAASPTLTQASRTARSRVATRGLEAMRYSPSVSSIVRLVSIPALAGESKTVVVLPGARSQRCEVAGFKRSLSASLDTRSFIGRF